MADMMYRLVLRATFENQAELTRAIEGLNQLQIAGAKVNVQMGGVGTTGAASLNSLGTSVLRLGFMFNMMESAFMRQEMAVMMAENAQNRLNDAVARYGANSEQARRAAEQYKNEMNYLNFANVRANVSMGLMAIQLILQSTLLDKVTLAQVTHTGSVIASTLAHWAEVAALKAKAVWEAIASGGLALPMMIGGGLAMTAITAYAFQSALTPQKADINIKTDINVETNIDDALKAQNDEVKKEYKRMNP